MHALGKVKRDEVFRVQTLLFPLWVGALGAIHHHKICFECFKLFFGWTDEHVLNEMSLPGHFGNKTHRQTGVCIRTAVSINNKEAFARELVSDQTFQMLPGFFTKRFIVVFTFAVICPPQRVAGGVVTDDVFIFWGTAGKYAGIYGYCTEIGFYAALKTFQIGVEFFVIQSVVIGVVNHFTCVMNSISLEILRGYAFNSHFTAP